MRRKAEAVARGRREWSLWAVEEWSGRGRVTGEGFWQGRSEQGAERNAGS